MLLLLGAACSLGLASDDLGHGPDKGLGAFDFGRKLIPGVGCVR